MAEAVYTRQGKIQTERAPYRQYTFPIRGGDTNDNIRIQIPYTATKGDLEEMNEHLAIIINRWIEN